MQSRNRKQRTQFGHMFEGNSLKKKNKKLTRVTFEMNSTK